MANISNATLARKQKVDRAVIVIALLVVLISVAVLLHAKLGEQGTKISEKAYSIVTEGASGQFDVPFFLDGSVPISLSRKDGADELSIVFSKDSACTETLVDLLYRRSLDVSEVRSTAMQFAPKDSLSADVVMNFLSFCRGAIERQESVILVISRK